MSIHKYTTGARTRNVINLSGSLSTSAVYSLTEANSEPSLATDGWKNQYSQKTLHVLIHNNNLKSDDGTPSNMNVSANKITFWGYNSSLGGVESWAPIRLNIGAGAGNTLQFPKVLVPDQIDYGDYYRMIVPIYGIERIAVVLDSSPFSGGSGTQGAGSLDVYLGVNTI